VLRRPDSSNPAGDELNDGYVGPAESRGRLDQCIEHRLQVEGGAADDLEHVGGGGLLLERFAQLLEQPHVLDGDDSLLGEIAEKLDCLSVNGRTSER
jgi:hypothetical protein